MSVIYVGVDVALSRPTVIVTVDADLMAYPDFHRAGGQ